MSPTARLAQNLRYLRLASDLTQEQMADVAQMDLTFYRQLETGYKPQIKVETVERLGRPFRLEVWQMLAPLTTLQRAKFKRPKARTSAIRGPRAKWKGIRAKTSG